MIDKTHQKTKPQAIVFPIRTKNRESQGGVGMGLHFLLGNVMILNSGLKENVVWMAREENFSREWKGHNRGVHWID